MLPSDSGIYSLSGAMKEVLQFFGVFCFSFRFSCSLLGARVDWPRAL